MKLSLLVISMFAAMALPASSQEDSTKTIHRIALDAVPSTIFHTNEFLRGGNDEARTMNHDMTFKPDIRVSVSGGTDCEPIPQGVAQL